MTRRDNKWAERYNHKVSKDAYIKRLGTIADFSIEKTDNNVAVVTYNLRINRDLKPNKKTEY